MIDTIYKYINVESGIKILKNKTLWFSKPERFNDPYDCYKRLIKITPSAKGIESYVDRNFPRIKKTERDRKIKYYLNNQETLMEDIKQGIKEREDNIGVTCFSKSFNNILMWSHYSDNHTGICIGFKFNFSTEDFFIYPVNYLHEFPNTDYFTVPENALLDWVLTKSTNWQYEQEIRAVSFNRSGIHSIESNVITEVYLGSKINPRDKEIIKSLSENTNIKLFQMAMEENRFELKAQVLTKNKVHLADGAINEESSDK